jgi:transcriptional regulator with XRE-family HTH domain
MKAIGEFIAERRKALGLSQKEMAELIKNRDGKSLSMPYLSYLENGRGEPPEYLLEQFARVLGVRPEVLYFWTRRMPPEGATGEASPQQVTGAYRAFQRELKDRNGNSGDEGRQS